MTAQSRKAFFTPSTTAGLDGSSKAGRGVDDLEYLAKRARVTGLVLDIGPLLRGGCLPDDICIALKMNGHRIEEIQEALEAQGIAIQKSILPAIVDAESFTVEELQIPTELVRGVIHLGSKGVFGGPSKAFKTWTLMHLCLSVANGADWLGFQTVQHRALYINFELQPFAVQRRLQAIAKAKGISVPRNLHIWNLRGHSCRLSKLLPELLRRIEGEGYGLIVPDPIYKTLDGRDENAAGDIGEVCNELEQVAVQTGAAIVFGAHFAKGNASGKESIDRISGSGVWARDPDSIIVATPHENEGCFSIEMTLRNFAPPPPFVVKWEYPLMSRDGELDPSRLKQPQRRTGSVTVRPELESLIPVAVALVKAKALSTAVFKSKLYRVAGTQERARDLSALLVADGHLAKLDVRGRGLHDTWIGTPTQIKELRQRNLDLKNG